MNEAKRKFMGNELVEMTPAGIKTRVNGVPKSHRLGRLVGFSRDGRLVRVKQQGLKSVSSWHPDFWKPRDSYLFRSRMNACLLRKPKHQRL